MEPASSKASDQIPNHVIQKLMFFSVAILLLPIVIYIIAIKFLDITPVYAGLSAAISANLVLVAFIIVAFREAPPPLEDENSKKKD